VGIDLDKLGRIYVADTANQRVSVFDKDGHAVKQIQVYGWEYFYTEPYLAIDSDNDLIYISDSKNNKVQIFNLDNLQSPTFKSFWGKEGESEGKFKLPLGIDIVGDKIYVAEGLNHRVQIFDKNSL